MSQRVVHAINAVSVPEQSSGALTVVTSPSNITKRVGAYR